MKKLAYITMAAIIALSSLLSSCTEEEVKITPSSDPSKGDTNPKQW